MDINSPCKKTPGIDAWLMTALAVLTATVFAVTCRFPLLDGWDDYTYITGNQQYLRPTPGNLLHWWKAPFYGFYIPLTMWSYMFDYAVWGLNGFGYHLQNVLWHIAAVLAVFKCFRFLGARPWTAFLFCAVFAVHPQRVESVVWVSERKDVMCAAFFFWSCYLYLRTDKDKWPVWSFVLFLAAMLSKSMAISLPFVLLAYEFSRRRTWRPQPYLKRLWPFLVVAAAYIPLTIKLNFVDHKRLDAVVRLTAASHNFFWYAANSLLPMHLNPLYPDVPPTWMTIAKITVMTVVLLAVMFMLYARLGKKSMIHRVLPVMFCFGITLAPVSGILPLGAIDRADRYSYIPSVFLWFGLAVLTDAFISGGYGRRFDMKRRYALITVVLVAYAGFLSMKTIFYSLVWRNQDLLWHCALDQPSINPMAYWFISFRFMDRGEYDQAYAVGEFLGGLESNPDISEMNRRGHYLRSRYIKGMVAAKRGQPASALKWLEQIETMATPAALGDRRPVVEMLSTMAYCHLSLKQTDRAVRKFGDIVEMLPAGNYEAWFYKGVIHYLKGDLDGAEACFSRALEAWPGDERSMKNLEQIENQRKTMRMEAGGAAHGKEPPIAAGI